MGTTRRSTKCSVKRVIKDDIPKINALDETRYNKMTLLENDQFLIELAKLFQKARLGGPQAVTITLKHYDGRTKPIPKSSASLRTSKATEDLCLFRAKLAEKKISTVVHPKEVNKFQLAYAAVMKSNMDNLKKRERKAAGAVVKGKTEPRKAKKAQ